MDKENGRRRAKGKRRKARAVREKTSVPGICRRLCFAYCLLPFAFCLFLSSCALPRIIVLDDPLSPEEHINLGLAYEQKGETDHAIGEYQKAAEKLSDAYLYLGNIYMHMNMPDQAEAFYRKTIEEAPALADAYNNLAWLYYMQGSNLEEAERLALKAVALNPAKEEYADTLNKIRELKSRNKL